MWPLLAVLCTMAFGFVTGLFNPEEKVNGLWLVVAAACFYVLAFRFYAENGDRHRRGGLSQPRKRKWGQVPDFDN